MLEVASIKVKKTHKIMKGKKKFKTSYRKYTPYNAFTLLSRIFYIITRYSLPIQKMEQEYACDPNEKKNGSKLNSHTYTHTKGCDTRC